MIHYHGYGPLLIQSLLVMTMDIIIDPCWFALPIESLPKKTGGFALPDRLGSDPTLRQFL